MLQITINSRPFTFGLPKENVFCLAAVHAYCRKYKMLVSCRQIEAEAAKRAKIDQRTMEQLGYVPVESEVGVMF